MALLQRGLSRSACVDQLDLANNHFGCGILWPRSPVDFSLEDGDLDGFEPAVAKLVDQGFVVVDGLLDDELASAIHDECKAQYYDQTAVGAMHQIRATTNEATGKECWLPYPPRKNVGFELQHALRVLFGLPHEIQKNGYPAKLKVPTMANLSCLSFPGGYENIHLDNPLDDTGGRELTLVLFCSPGWSEVHGGQLCAYLDSERDVPGAKPRPRSADSREAHEARPKDFEPEAGRCLIFRSKALWHEVLPTSRLQFALTLFVQAED